MLASSLTSAFHMYYGNSMTGTNLTFKLKLFKLILIQLSLKINNLLRFPFFRVINSLKIFIFFNSQKLDSYLMIFNRLYILLSVLVLVAGNVLLLSVHLQSYCM